ncbi:MAG TPA: hypothetical protein PLE28_03485 [bacterium]|nr:hypothetical protein [bacterium]
MISFFRKKIFLFHILFFLILLSGFIWPSVYYWSLLVFNLLFIVFVLIFNKILLDKKRLIFFVLPWLFINSLSLYSSLLINKILIIILLFLGLIISYYYFAEFRQRLNRDFNFNFGNFSILSDIEGLSLVFLGSSFIYGLVYFLSVKNWILLLTILTILFFTIRQNIFIIKKQVNETLLASFLFLLALIPIVGALFFLPFNFNILGLILSLCYYGGLNFVRFYLSDSLTNKKIKYNLIFIIASLIIVFLTISWR